MGLQKKERWFKALCNQDNASIQLVGATMLSHRLSRRGRSSEHINVLRINAKVEEGNPLRPRDNWKQVAEFQL